MATSKPPSYYNRQDELIEKASKSAQVIFAVTPKNLATEKKKFLSSTAYNPQFTYKPLNVDIKRAFFRLQKMKFDDTPMGQLLAKKRDDTILRLRVMQSIGTDDFVKYCVKLYGKPDKRLRDKAQKFIVQKIPKDTGKRYSNRAISLYFQTALAKYGLHWKVRSKNMIANAAVSGPNKTLYIKQKTSFTRKNMKQLVFHEIGTHILRIENGLLQPYSIFSKGLPGYLPTEEGLALYNQEIHGCMNPRLFKMYAARVLAVDYALSHSFRETFNFLREYFKPEQAWNLTVRVKRGMTDTSKPGSFTKDHVYLKGYYLIHSYLKKGGKIDDLYYGKIGVQHVDLVKSLPNLVHPRYLPVQRYLLYFASFFEEAFSFPLSLMRDFFRSTGFDPAKFFRKYS